MKRYLKGFYMSLGMFSAIPLPFRRWDEASTNLVIPCFPLIGLLLGALWWGFAELLVFCGIHVMLTAAVLSVAPFLLTGFIHLDGYMDTSDAALSRRSLEDKVRILKDPHKGAFAVIMLAVLFVVQFAAVYTVVDLGKDFTSLVFISVISRCCASVALLGLKAMPHSGYVPIFRRNTRASHKIFVVVVMALAMAASYLVAGPLGLVVVASVVLGFAGAMAYLFKEFKGISGDLTGFSLVISELCGIVALGTITWF